MLAREGCDIVVCDIGEQIDSVPYSLGTEAELAETVKLVRDLNRRCVAVKADVRRLPEMQAVAERAIGELGHIDILLANAGIASDAPIAEMSAQQWREVIDVNLTGVFHSFRAVVPHTIERGTGRIVATASVVARMGARNSGHYAAAEWGDNKATYNVLRPDLGNPTKEDVLPLFEAGPPLLEPEDVSNAILFLVSDNGGYLSGETLTLSAGLSASNAT
jgi:NAD(P)-dependent dehydrogenase (short-subunit alcohol dehydrogenase family)